MADISKIKALDGTTYDVKDTVARNAINNVYTRPMYGIGTSDIAMRPLVPEARANRVWFLPADQIIIEQTTDGGITWASAGISDTAKTQLFSGTRPQIKIPLLNSARSTNCGIRITFSAMKYNVPSGTAETGKYDYWNSTYVNRNERYTTLTEFWFWLGGNGDTIRAVVEAATGAKSTTWVKCFDTNDYSIGFTGWSGSDWCRFGSKTFGGGTNQTSNYWNWRITLWSRFAEGKSEFQQSTNQAVYHIAGYGESWWVASNNLMKNDHLYSFDYQQNATFPAKITATSFEGTATNATTAVNVETQGSATNSTARHIWFSDSSTETKRAHSDNLKYTPSTNTVTANISGTAATVNGHTVDSDVPSNAVFTDTTYESKTAASGGTDLSLVTTGEKYRWNTKDIPAGGTAGQVLAKTSNTDYATEWVNQSGGGGTSDYDDLTDKPSINNITLSGNKTAAELGLAASSDIPTVPVQSVNGKTGAVVLSASDVGALPDDTAIPSKTSDLTNDSGFLTSAPVTSINNKTGDVTLTASDVGAGTYSKPSGGIPASDLESAVQTSLGKADTALQSVPSTYRTAAAQDIIDAAQNTEIANLKINHRNLLDNWYFIGTGSQNGVGYLPINQRGQQSYSGSGYGIDRWRAGGNAPSNFTTTTSNSGLTIKDARTSGTNTNWFNQNFDRPLRPGTYTLSALISSISGSGKIGILNDSNSYISNNARQDITTGLTTVTFTVSDSTATKVAFVINAATTVKISAVKLELGSYQTLAHQENGTWVLNEIPSYDEELLKCQKYFQIIPPCGSYLVPIGSGIGYDTTQIRINLPLVTAMVKTPTVTVQNCSIRFYQDSLSSAITTYSSVSAATGNWNAHYRPYAILIFTVSGAINGKKAELVINTSGGDNPGILLSAEE